MQKATLYQTLSDGQWHSGQALADALGVSRTMVWKAIEKLRGDGLSIESCQGKGYRLASSGAQLYQRGVIEAAFSEQAQREITALIIEDSVTSTNDVCLATLHQPQAPNQPAAPSGVLVLAERQTAGRGRRGKAWVSPYAANIYLSISQRFEQGAGSLSGLSLVVGLAVAQAINRLTGEQRVGLKWPNDIYIEGRKVGGILLEVSGDIAGPCNAVIGIGLNLQMPPGEGEAINQPYTDLHSAFPAQQWNKNQLVAELVNELLANVAVFRQSGFAPFKARWLERDIYLNQPVIIRHDSADVDSGTHAGVADDGSILLQTVAGLKPYGGGEISLRPSDV